MAPYDMRLFWPFALLACFASSHADGRPITVSAASSLSEVMTAVARAYEVQYPGAKVVLNLGASGMLLQQIQRGAPVDVLAAADQETMDKAVAEGLVVAGTRQTIARNSLVLVVPKDAKDPPTRLQDLADTRVKRFAIGHPGSVPAGRYAKAALTFAQLWERVAGKAISTQNVRQALDYVARGEVDAAIVYATDAALLPHKVKVALVLPHDPAISYPLARLIHGGDEAQRFVDFVLSPVGKAAFKQYGFAQP